MAEFSISDGRLDCFAFFRKQEMQFWWPVNVAELAALQAAVATGLKMSAGRIVTFSAVALWKGRLPAVAVPTIDLLVEESTRLWDMALAIAWPKNATEQSRKDWDQVLGDLADSKRRSRIGAELLAEHARRIVAVAPSRSTRKVASSLEVVAEQFRILADTKELNDDAVRAIEQRVAALRSTVTAALR